MENKVVMAVDYSKPETQLATVLGYAAGYKQCAKDVCKGVLMSAGLFAVGVGGYVIIDLIASKRSNKKEKSEK